MVSIYFASRFRFIGVQILSVQRITYSYHFQTNRLSLILITNWVWHRSIRVTLVYEVAETVRFFLCHGIYLLFPLRPLITEA